MKKLLKILVVYVIISMIGITLLPVLNLIPANMGSIFLILNKISESMISRASDIDYEYGGNLRIVYINGGNMFGGLPADTDGGYHFYKGGLKTSDSDPVDVDYCVNGGEIVACESPSTGSKKLNLDKKINTVVAKTAGTDQIIYEAILIEIDDALICFQKAFSSRLDATSGDRIYYISEESQEPKDFEYSMDNGETFTDISKTQWWHDAEPVVGGTLFEDKIIIRDKNTQEIIYQTPNMGDIQEEYSYEDGMTTITFENTNDEIEDVEYSYEIDGQETEGNVIEVEEDSSVILRAKANIEFSEKVIEKEVQVKVIKTEEPIIEIDEENNLEITPGNVENDEIANIYYIIDDGDPIVYTEKVALDIEPGEHTINAYQVTTNGIESQMAEENITIESDEAEEDNKEEESEEQNEENKEENKEEQNEEKSEDKTEPEKEGNEDSSNKENAEEVKDDKKEDTNKEEKNNSSKENDVAKKENKLNKLLPQTGDKVIIFAVVVMGIVLLNVVINSKKR